MSDACSGRSYIENDSRGDVGRGTVGTILVVEDEVLVRSLLADELRQSGYNVVEAGSADDARRLLESGLSIALILTDVCMPGALDGAALARLVRAQHPHIKLIVVSGNVGEEELGARVDMYVAKPYELSSLMQRVAALLH